MTPNPLSPLHLLFQAQDSVQCSLADTGKCSGDGVLGPESWVRLALLNPPEKADLARMTLEMGFMKNLHCTFLYKILTWRLRNEDRHESILVN